MKTDDIVLPDEVTKIEQQILSENICSIKIGTPAKGGEVKIYFNPDKLDEALQRVITSCQLNKATQILHEDPFNEEEIKQVKELLFKQKKMDSEVVTEKPIDSIDLNFNEEVTEALAEIPDEDARFDDNIDEGDSHAEPME